MGAAVAEAARAKINLFLHVLGRRADGYHTLESLAAFADIGDSLEAQSAESPALALDGPEAGALASSLADGSNLVLRAAERFAAVFPGAHSARFRLVKALPVASGLGGGSADAAAALRALARLNDVSPDDPRLMTVAAALGADVPVCLRGEAGWMGGVGEELQPLDALPPLPAVLVNPRVPVETRRVFEALGLERGQAGPSAPLGTRPSGFADREILLGFLAARRNDLESVARGIAPEIGDGLNLLDAAPGCRLARMTGSGATCFGLFETAGQAHDASRIIAAERPEWWVVAVTLS